MWLNPQFMHQPIQHRGRAIDGAGKTHQRLDEFEPRAGIFVAVFCGEAEPVTRFAQILFSAVAVIVEMPDKMLCPGVALLRRAFKPIQCFIIASRDAFCPCSMYARLYCASTCPCSAARRNQLAAFVKSFAAPRPSQSASSNCASPSPAFAAASNHRKASTSSRSTPVPVFRK